MSEHTTSLLPMHRKVSLSLMIKEEKAGSSSMDLLGENPVQCTLSLIKPIYEESLRNTMLLLTAITLYWSFLALTSSQPNFLGPQLLQQPAVNRCNPTAFCLRCIWHVSLSAQGFLCLLPGKVTGTHSAVLSHAQT